MNTASQFNASPVDHATCSEENDNVQSAIEFFFFLAVAGLVLTWRSRLSSSSSSSSSSLPPPQKARRWGTKEVDRSLYGHRDYASKNPALSPITEGLGGFSPSPPLQPPGSRRRRSSKGNGRRGPRPLARVAPGPPLRRRARSNLSQKVPLTHLLGT